MAAARPLLLLAPAAMALVLALLLSGIPPSAPDPFASHPLGELLTKTGTANATSSSTASTNSSESLAPAPSPPSSASDLEEQKEKRRQRQEEAKALDAAFWEYGRANSVVSPTNGAGSYKGMAREFVKAHNEFRTRYGVPPVRWDKKLARHARRWCHSMRGHCELMHSVTEEGYGESIFLSKENWNATATDAVKSWATEEPIYDKATGNCTNGLAYKECGHFALMVDKRNQWVGCARSECVKGGVFISCNYFIHDPSKDH